MAFRRDVRSKNPIQGCEPMEVLTDREEKEFLSSQQAQADKWRAKLADPLLP